MQRDEDGLRGRQRVHREQSERGRAIDEYRVVPIGDRLDQAPKPALSRVHAGKLDLGASQRDGRWRQPDAPACRHDDVVEGHPIDNGVIDRAIQAMAIQAEAAGGIALGIEVDHEDAVTLEGEIARQIHNRRGLSDAALLIRAGDRSTHSVTCPERSHEHKFYHQTPDRPRSGRFREDARPDVPAAHQRGCFT